MPKPIAIWNADLDCWLVSDDETESLFSVPSAVWSETFPRWAMWDESGLYELPTLAPLTDDSGTSSLPTPRATPRATRGGSSTETVALLPTTTAEDAASSGGGSPSDVTLTDAVVRTDFGRRANPRHSSPPPTSRDWKDGAPNDNVPVNALLGRTVWSLLPTPRAVDATDIRGRTENRSDEANARAGRSLTDEMRLPPTPSVADVEGGRKSRSGDRSDEMLLNGIAHAEQWGKYAACINQWAELTRPAPEPTEPGPRGGRRLSPRFSEWMMGLPDGWVTTVPGLSRTDQLRAIGNGVVPQQATAALHLMLGQAVAA